MPTGRLQFVSDSTSANSNLAVEGAFSSMLIDTVCEAVGGALGRNVLEILASKGLLDNSNDSEEFDRKLRSLFGNGELVLERIVIRDLYRKLGIPYDSTDPFDYESSLVKAREACFVESTLK
ncbi:MAG: hypothetical protein AUJ07_04075 [Crenarchaeota archaeon 13_1_40CM_3_53_5]|nr:MAG: hypothetical protein AUJ07_04075 [Crenarchaeota archaeon 13_1_40CM_3_53_5]